MKAKPSRRGFLRGTGLVAMGFATGGTIICAADYAWALSTTAIDGHTAETLLVVARQLFPHDRLGDQYYAVMVDSLDKQAAGDPALRKLLVDGVGRLDSARGIAWVQLSNGARDAVLKSMEGSEFFATIQNGHHQQSLYQPPGLSLLRLRRIIGRAWRLHPPGFRRHRLAAELVMEDRI